MASQYDLAQELDARFREQALAQHKKGTGDKSRPSRTHCIDCGEKIPDGRRIAAPGCIRCLDCEEELERAQRRKR